MIEVSIGSVLTKIRRAGKLKNADYQASGRYPVIDQGEGQIGGYSDDESLVHFSPLPIVIFGDHTRRVKLAKEPFICGADGTQLLYPTEDFDPVYFFYAVKNVDLSNYHYARHFKFLKDQNIIKHDRPTQQKIAGILATYDDLIENNLKRIKLLEEMAQITYEEWFVRLRFPGHESTPINPETGLPEGWQSISCYDAMEVMSGGTPKTSMEEYWNGNIPFYTPKDAVDSSYVFETEKYVTELGVKKCNSKLYPKDTVFITARGTVGKVNLAGQPMAMNQSCYALAGKEGISTYFLFFAVKASVEAFKGASNGGVFNTIVVDTFRYLPFTKPTPALMKKFEVFVSPILAEVSNLTQQNQRLREARDILLPRLMTGVIDVESYDPAQLLKEAA